MEEEYLALRGAPHPQQRASLANHAKCTAIARAIQSEGHAKLPVNPTLGGYLPGSNSCLILRTPFPFPAATPAGNTLSSLGCWGTDHHKYKDATPPAPRIELPLPPPFTPVSPPSPRFPWSLCRTVVHVCSPPCPFAKKMG